MKSNCSTLFEMDNIAFVVTKRISKIWIGADGLVSYLVLNFSVLKKSTKPKQYPAINYKEEPIFFTKSYFMFKMLEIS